MSIPAFNVPARQALASFGYNFPNWSNTTPFTYQDGMTSAKLLESLIKYIDTILVPYVDDEMAEVIKAWEDTVTEIIDSVINSSIELQDIVVTELLNDANSLFRTALNTILTNLIVEDTADPGTYIIR